jgi:hypothetical protein
MRLEVRSQRRKPEGMTVSFDGTKIHRGARVKLAPSARRVFVNKYKKQFRPCTFSDPKSRCKRKLSPSQLATAVSSLILLLSTLVPNFQAGQTFFYSYASCRCTPYFQLIDSEGTTNCSTVPSRMITFLLTETTLSLFSDGRLHRSGSDNGCRDAEDI